MARSKIIKDIANSSTDVSTALKRAKVLLSELENRDLLDWVNYELSGYPEGIAVPDYRNLKGNIIGSFFKGSMANHMKWTNVSLPLGKMPDDMRDALLTVSFRESVDALKKLAENADDPSVTLGKVIPADFFPAIANYNNDPYMNITSARVILGSQAIQGIFSTIETRLLDMFILLEKEFGNLDELDIDLSTKTQDQLDEIIRRLVVIVFNDNSVNIGDGNRIKGSNIASQIKGE